MHIKCLSQRRQVFLTLLSTPMNTTLSNDKKKHVALRCRLRPSQMYFCPFLFALRTTCNLTASVRKPYRRNTDKRRSSAFHIRLDSRQKGFVDGREWTRGEKEFTRVDGRVRGVAVKGR